MRRRWTDQEIQNFRKKYHQQIIYFNPQDARFVVPKYIGIGITINFGHIFTLVVVIAIIAIAVLNNFI